MAAHTRAGGWGRLLLATALVVALDQATKQAVVSWLERGESVNVFLGIEMTNIRNDGVAFGALGGSGAIVGVLVGAAVLALLAYFAMNADVAWLWLPAGLTLGGALGNVTDRLREGAVIDFIDPIAWPAFNVADSAIVVGVLALLYVVEARPGDK